MSEGLEIRKGGKLFRTRWVDKKEGHVTSDVTDRAITCLFDRCTLEEGVTLKDIFLLLNTELDIFDTIIGNWCKEIVTEGLSREPSADRDSEIEYLELYWHFYKDKDWDTKKPFFGGHIFPSFGGQGYVHKEDYYQDEVLHCKAGDRISYGISFTPSYELINLPVKLETSCRIFNEDDWKETPQQFDHTEYSLGHILYGIVWEMSFYGGPESRDKVGQELRDTVAEIKSAENLDDLLKGINDDDKDKLD